MSIVDRLKSAWNAFNTNEDEFKRGLGMYDTFGTSSFVSSHRSSAVRCSKGSIIDTIESRIANDVSMVDFKHVKKDNDPKTESIVKSGFNRCLQLEANVDQSAIDFRKDLVMSMMDEGVVAVVPVDTDDKVDVLPNYDILSMRVGQVTQWYPQHVKVRLYNDRNGQTQEILKNKREVAIIENPLYEVVNAQNSTLKRLIRKLQLIDHMDETIASNKLDLLVSLPYAVKGEIRQQQAKQRVEMIQQQLAENKYGIAYIDSTEHVTQLNRPIENNLLKEVEYLSNELFNQLGLTKAVFDGTAGEQELRSYYDRTINPIAKRIALEFNRKFLTDTARTQGHEIVYYSDPFKLVPTSAVASMADSLRRNAILSSNEIREILGFQPSDDARADELFNPNIADSNQMMGAEGMGMATADGGTGEIPAADENPVEGDLVKGILKESVEGKGD